jgi:hypothetical protein
MRPVITFNVCPLHLIVQLYGVLFVWNSTIQDEFCGYDPKIMHISEQESQQQQLATINSNAPSAIHCQIIKK